MPLYKTYGDWRTSEQNGFSNYKQSCYLITFFPSDWGVIFHLSRENYDTFITAEKFLEALKIIFNFKRIRTDTVLSHDLLQCQNLTFNPTFTMTFERINIYERLARVTCTVVGHALIGKLLFFV